MDLSKIKELNTPQCHIILQFYLLENQLMPVMGMDQLGQLMKKKGTCHGQCLAILEQLKEDPSRHPADIFAALTDNPSKVFYFQILEIIRGFCNDQLFIKQPEYQAQTAKVITQALVKKESRLSQRLTLEWQSHCSVSSSLRGQEILDMTQACQFAPDQIVKVNSDFYLFDSLKDSNQKLEEYLNSLKNVSILMRCCQHLQNAHTLFYHCAELGQNFWFYDPNLLGLCQPEF